MVWSGKGWKLMQKKLNRENQVAILLFKVLRFEPVSIYLKFSSIL